MDKEPQHCWEFRNCPEETRKNCAAFTYSEEKCWMIASHVSGKWCPKAKGKGIMYCFEECGWYKKLNPNEKLEGLS